jgi:hypothetical protein
MSAHDEAAPATRPALATAGGLLLAVALLQIAQQVIGVFSPRPSIQAGLVVAVGLAVLTAERLRSAASGSLDRVAVVSGLVCLAALAATGVIWATSGFSTPAKPTVAAQVDDIRAALHARGYKVTYHKLLLGQGAASHLFVAGRPKLDANRRPSDEVLLYDNDHGELRRVLDFRPAVTLTDAQNAAAGATFTRSAVEDLDGDGQKELLASWDTNRAGAEYQRVPVLIARQRQGRYAVTPLLDTRSLDSAVTDGLPTYGFGPAGGRGSPSVWVSDLALDEQRGFLPRDGTLATSVVSADPHQLALTAIPADANGRRVPGIPRTVRFWTIDLSGARPVTRPLCILGAPLGAVPVPEPAFRSTAYLRQPLADALLRAGGGLGEWHDDVCGDPAL